MIAFIWRRGCVVSWFNCSGSMLNISANNCFMNMFVSSNDIFKIKNHSENNKIFFKSTQKTFYKRLKMFINSRWTIKYDFTQRFYASRKNTWGVTPFTIILPHYQTITISINIIRFSNAPIKIIENRSSCFPLPNPFSSIVSCTKTEPKRGWRLQK